MVISLALEKVCVAVFLLAVAQWFMVTNAAETKNLTVQVQHFQENLQNKNSQQDTRVQNLETTLKNKISQQDARVQSLKANLQNTSSQQNGRIQTLETKLQSLEKTLEAKINKIEGRLNKVSPTSCIDILAGSKSTVSGTYWIQPTLKERFKVYCDMETHGGGWTLVYSYTFTNYNSFTSSSNAVTPRPNWPASDANVPISTTPPLSESSRGAVDFSLWREIGQDIMIKSNINDWIVCKPNGGSLVTKENGGMSCQNIKNVAAACYGVAPDKVHWHRFGPYLKASHIFYDFVGNTHYDWPAHDPCGERKADHKKGVSNPGGQIYLR